MADSVLARLDSTVITISGYRWVCTDQKTRHLSNWPLHFKKCMLCHYHTITDRGYQPVAHW